ncbi:hypothetical protein ACS0TY_020926 [Phlomoides rotata]
MASEPSSDKHHPSAAMVSNKQRFAKIETSIAQLSEALQTMSLREDRRSGEGGLRRHPKHIRGDNIRMRENLLYDESEEEEAVVENGYTPPYPMESRGIEKEIERGSQFYLLTPMGVDKKEEDQTKFMGGGPLKWVEGEYDSPPKYDEEVMNDNLNDRKETGVQEAEVQVPVREKEEELGQHESNGNQSAAYECYHKAIDISPPVFYNPIQVFKQGGAPLEQASVPITVCQYIKEGLERARDRLSKAAAMRERFVLGTSVGRRVAAVTSSAEAAAATGESSFKSFMIAVQWSGSSVAIVQQYFTNSVSQLLLPVDAVYAASCEEMASAMSSAEGSACKGLQQCIDTVMAEVERLLSTEQKATDYRSSDDGMRAAFQLLHMVLQQSVWLDDAFDRAKQLYLPNYRSIPKSLERSTAHKLMLAMLDGDERFVEPTPNSLQKLTLEQVKEAVDEFKARFPDLNLEDKVRFEWRGIDETLTHGQHKDFGKVYHIRKVKNRRKSFIFQPKKIPD